MYHFDEVAGASYLKKYNTCSYNTTNPICHQSLYYIRPTPEILCASYPYFFESTTGNPMWRRLRHRRIAVPEANLQRANLHSIGTTNKS
jgi:hypothetical protein